MDAIVEQNASLILIVNWDNSIKILKNRNGMKKGELIRLLSQSNTPDTNHDHEDEPSE